MRASSFSSLPPKHKALVAIAVLLDGREAGVYLEQDAIFGESLRDAALELADHDPELRMAYVGTVLRHALSEIANQ